MYLAYCSTDKYRQAQPKILIVHIEITRACWIGQTLDGTAFGLVKQNGSQFLSPIKIFSFSLGSINYSDWISNRYQPGLHSNGNEVLQSNHKSTFFRVVIPCSCRRSDTIYLAWRTIVQYWTIWGGVWIIRWLCTNWCNLSSTHITADSATHRCFDMKCNLYKCTSKANLDLLFDKAVLHRHGRNVLDS